jgi:hypothetical protein
MKLTLHPMALAAAAVLAGHLPSHAGTSAANKMAVPMAEEPFGQITFGAKFSKDLQSGYVDVLSGLVHNSNNAFFLNIRGTFADDDQQILSAGLGFRHLFEDPGIIVGGNVYYDYIDSENGNGINQLGLGAEILTKWVDARFNYYLPDNDRHLVRTFTVNDHSRGVSPPFDRNGFVQESVRTTDKTTTFGIFEQAIEGWNAEAGVLVPGLDKYLELRLFAGAYGYNNPHGGDFNGFKARAEARITEGVTLDVEYWEDKELVGGNWVAGVRVSLPFDIGLLCQGKNPFEGAGDMFKFRSARNLHERMDEMVIRSHRVMTALSKPEPMGSSTTTNVNNVQLDPIRRGGTPPKATGGGGGGDEGGGGDGGEGGGGNEKPPT